MSESSLSQVLSSLERLQKEVASIKGDVDIIKGKSSKHLLEPLAQVRSTDTSGQLQGSDDDNESLLTQELVGETSAEPMPVMVRGLRRCYPPPKSIS